MPNEGKSSSKPVIIGILIFLVMAAGALVLGYLPRRSTTQQLDRIAATQKRTPPIVNAAFVTRAPKSTEASFPGSITPITEAYIFARAAGYLKSRYVDIGDKVAAGQLLA